MYTYPPFWRNLARRTGVTIPLGLLALSSAALPLTMALAADTPGPADGMAPAAAAIPVAATNDDQIEEITVYARKRSESIQQVPVPITVLTPHEIERDDLSNFTNFQVKFPAFSVYLTNPKQLNLGIRGVGNNGFNTDGIDASVGVFVDGVYSGRLGLASGDFSDVAQVELLRGPQGTLFGKNTTAGAVLINTQLPSFTPEGDAQVTEGNYGFQEYKINVSGPLVEDKLAMRLSAYYSEHDGYYDNLYNNNRYNGRQSEGVRLQLLDKITDDLTFRLIASHGTQDFPSITPLTIGIYNPAALQARMATAGYSLPISNADQKDVNINSRLQSFTRSNFISGQANWDLAEAGTITSITAYQDWYCHTYNDNDYTQLNAIPDYGSCNQERQFSQELRWASVKGGPIEAVGGAFVSRQNLAVDSRMQYGDQYYIWAANPSTTAFPTVKGRSWANGAYSPAVTGAQLQSHADFRTQTEAIFGNATWHPDEEKRWSLDVGLRQTWEDRHMDYNGWVAANPGGLSMAQLNALSPGAGNAQLGSASDSLSDVSLSGQVGLNYQITDDIMAYVMFSRGHKSKGFNLLAENASNPDPGVAVAIAHGAAQHIAGEQANNVEAGIKSEWLDHHLLVNLTLFDELIRNYQANESIAVGTTSTKFLANVGVMRSQGAELEAEAKLYEGLHLKGFVAYDLATYSSFHNAVCPSENTALSCDLTGRQVAWAPKWTTDLTLEYTRKVAEDISAYIAVDENWRSNQNTTITLDPLANINSYALTNLRVGMITMGGALDVQFWVNNLLDKSYWSNLLGYTKSTGIVQGYAGDPRTLGGTVRYHF